MLSTVKGRTVGGSDHRAPASNPLWLIQPWVVVSAAGGASPWIVRDLLGGGTLSLAVAVIVGLALPWWLQGFLVRTHGVNARWWLPASVVAAVAGGLLRLGLGLAVGTQTPAWPQIVLVGAAEGGILGVTQWLCLRRLPRASWWILASTVGVTARAALLYLLGGGAVAPLHTAFLSWALYGVITGATLARLLTAQSASSEASP